MTVRHEFNEKLMTSQVSKLRGLKALASLDIVQTITSNEEEMSIQDVDLVVKVLAEYRSTIQSIDQILNDFEVSLDDFKLTIIQMDPIGVEDSSLSDITDKGYEPRRKIHEQG